MIEEQRLKEEQNGYNTKEKIKSNDEVFTPPFLIEEMLDNLSPDVWLDPNKTWLDPCAGLGNFSVIILRRLMEGLKIWEPNEARRKKYILENMLYHIEMNPESIVKLKRVLDPDNIYDLNIKCDDFLTFDDPKTTALF